MKTKEQLESELTDILKQLSEVSKYEYSLVAENKKPDRPASLEEYEEIVYGKDGAFEKIEEYRELINCFYKIITYRAKGRW